MMLKNDKHNIQVLLDYFLHNKYEALKVKNGRLDGYTRRFQDPSATMLSLSAQ